MQARSCSQTFCAFRMVLPIFSADFGPPSSNWIGNDVDKLEESPVMLVPLSLDSTTPGIDISVTKVPAGLCTLMTKSPIHVWAMATRTATRRTTPMPLAGTASGNEAIENVVPL